MFTDIKTSLDLNRDYKNAHSNVLINANVLTSTYWPSWTTSNFLIPNEIKNEMKRFEDFYSHRHNGRKITWVLQHSNIDVKVCFGKIKKEVNCSMACYSVLYTFNVESTRSFQDILQITDVSELELKKILASLSLFKHKILIKAPPSNEINISDSFTFNSNFKSPHAKIKISNQKSAIESDADRATTISKVDEGRKHQIEAAIVRVMKARIVLDHNSLVSEVISLLSGLFKPSIVGIKQRIDGLIEREYIKRDEKDFSKFHYIA